MKTVRCQGQPSWPVRSDLVEAHFTQRGGHLGPVRFRLGRRTVEPYSVAPWVQEKSSEKLPGVLRSLRGDFLCLPFGGNDTPYRGEKHLPHGETANDLWTGESLERAGDATTLSLSLQTKVRRGRVDRSVMLRDGHTALYCRDAISGMAGPMCGGHHAMLKFPEAAESGLISTSPIRWAQVLPTPFERAEFGGYSALKPGARFSRLDRCPALDGTTADLSRYPARRGFEDLVMLVHEAASDFAWTAVTFPRERYVWFALKDPRILRSTVFWISNGGRHYAPWNGRHVNVLGIEDVTAYFHYGLAESVKANPIRPGNYPTVFSLCKDRPFVIPYIMAMAEIPAGFDRVKSIRRGAGTVTLRAASGKSVTVALDHAFLRTAPGRAGQLAARLKSAR